jgi:hypothetical protein
MKRPAGTAPDRYPGLPEGAFHVDNLPPQALASYGSSDKGVWSTAASLYLNTVDPQTGNTYNGQPLTDVAHASVQLAASNCRALAIEFSAHGEKRVEELEVEAATRLAVAVDQIEHAASLLDEPVTGPDGEVTDGRGLLAVQRADEELARQRSGEGDSRHTEQMWASGWRIIAATLLGLLDLLLLWKPLLNLSFESSSGSVFRWAVGGGLAALQVLAIEWAVRTYVDSERLSVDRRGAAGDYNRPLRTGRIVSDRHAPTAEELIEADTRMTHAYRVLVAIASFIAVIGGVRVAVLAKRAGLAGYEAALFGTIVGLILGAVVVQMARLYCRGNLLGDRLLAEREALAELNDKIQHARGAVAQERENALAALAEAELQSASAARIRTQTVADYWRAVQLAWTWFGLPHRTLDFAAFEQEALPVPPDSSAIRKDLRHKLDRVNQWLGERPTVFDRRHPALALIASGGGVADPAEPAPPDRFLVSPPADGQLVILGPQPIAVPIPPRPPHSWMLAGAAVTVIATIATALLSPGPEAADQQTALPASAAARR